VSSAFGELFRLSTFGESHGKAVGATVDGCIPGLPLSTCDIQTELDRRRPGQSRLVTQRKESDTVQILSGVYQGVTTGTPIAMMVTNADQRPGAYDHLENLYRPNHADYTYAAKYGTRDHRGGGRASARETVGRVAGGAIARKLLSHSVGVEILAWVSQVGSITSSISPDQPTLDDVEADPTRCPDPQTALAMTKAIDSARRAGDSLGGIVTVVARNVPAGWGEPVFDKIDADLAKAMLSIPAAKAFEIGSGFAGSAMTGSAHSDPFVPGPDGQPVTTSNFSGGVQGGITNGADIVCRVGFKPTATISSPQMTVTTDGEPTELRATGRHDPCVVPRAVPIVEAMMALVLVDHWLRQRAISPPN